MLLCGLSNNLYLLTSSQGALPKLFDSSQSALLLSKAWGRGITHFDLYNKISRHFSLL